MKTEFKLLKAIIADLVPEDYDYVPEGANAKARKADYNSVEIIPVSDPNSATMAQRIVQYQAVMQLAQQAPQIYDLPQLHRQMVEVLGVQNAGKIIPNTDEPSPRDPISENMGTLVGKPTKAYIYQDHDAHIAAHQSFMQDPMIAQTIGQNPMAQSMMAAIQAHIAEHLSFKYRKMVEDRMGVPLPKPNEEMPEDLEVELSRMVAQASQQVLQANQQMAAQQKAQQQAQDPLIQMQQQELQLKSQDLQRKAAKDQADNQLAQQKLAIEAAKANAPVPTPVQSQPQAGTSPNDMALKQREQVRKERKDQMDYDIAQRKLMQDRLKSQQTKPTATRE
jgi:hypothetical protein